MHKDTLDEHNRKMLYRKALARVSKRLDQLAIEAYYQGIPLKEFRRNLNTLYARKWGESSTKTIDRIMDEREDTVAKKKTDKLSNKEIMKREGQKPPKSKGGKK